MDRPPSLTEFILQQESNFKYATGNFTLLLSQIEFAGRIIASHVRKAGLVDILSETGTKNATDDQMIVLDQYSNDLLIDVLSQTKSVHAVASEEMEELLIIDKNKGEYDIFFDPLDGSKNTEINVTVGTIFSIYKRSDSLLQPGKNQVASGYILYGSSVMLVYTTGNGVHGFTLDPSIGSFLLSHKDIRIPEHGSIYSLNEGNFELFNNQTKDYINFAKSRFYKSRYIGSMVADVHRTLLKGGTFMYPGDSTNKNGKLRLMFEVNPLAYLIEQSGGKAISSGDSPTNINPETLHQKAPIILGSPKNIEEYLKFIK